MPAPHPAFDAAYAFTVERPDVEGGYVLTNKASDPGGMTYAGISRRYHPSWEGWPLIDRSTALTDARLIEACKAFYYIEFWLRICGDAMPPALVAQVFDMAVNSGPEDARKCLQRAIGGLTVDGILGPKTLAAIPTDAAQVLRVLMRFNAARLRHYTTNTPRQAWADNGRGWANRIALTLEEAART